VFIKGPDFAAPGWAWSRDNIPPGGNKLLGFSNRRTPYLRRVFIHGVQSIFTGSNRHKLALTLG
jgi:hypothetical protein